MSFFRGWNDYKLGFGRADGEYWLGKVGPWGGGYPSAKSLLTSCHPSLGLQNLYLLTLKQKYELRVDLEDFENNTAYAKYVDFSISPNAVSAEEDGYTLYVAGFEDGGAGNPISFFRGSGGGGQVSWPYPIGSLRPLWQPFCIWESHNSLQTYSSHMNHSPPWPCSRQLCTRTAVSLCGSGRAPSSR